MTEPINVCGYCWDEKKYTRLVNGKCDIHD